MSVVMSISGVLVLAGALFLLAGIAIANRLRHKVPPELRGRWKAILSLMVFFLLGYFSFVAVLPIGSGFPLELISGAVFFGGAVFVFIVINLSRETVGRMQAAKEDLRRMNESLEQRIEERTREVRNSNAFLKTVVDSLHDAVCIIDVSDLSIVGVNAVFLREVGLPEVAVIGKRCYEVAHVRSSACRPPDEACPLHEAVEKGKHASAEHCHRGAGGQPFYVEVTASPVIDNDGRVVRVVHVARDITERKRAEERLRFAAEELKTSNEELKSFVYSVSHDLRAPLLNIKGFSAELRRALREAEAVLEEAGGCMAPERREHLSRLFRDDAAEAMGFISSSVDRMDGQLNSLLKLSRLGRRELRPEPLDMEDLTQFLLSTLDHQIKEKRAAVTVGPLPRVTADRAAMEQIMGNLLDNAVKYLEPGRAGAISISAEQGAAETLFRVADNGRGIAGEDLPKIFEVFRRVGRQDVPGEGMGLSYVKAMVRRHGGRIWCESEPGGGSAFLFTIPVAAGPV
jgi:PAS domain S-box-containing protein